MKVKNNKLYIGDVSAEALAKKFGTPLYVYDRAVIEERYRDLKKNIPYDDLAIHYACKANTNPEILKLFKKLGSGAETVSEGEIEIALAAGFKPSHILYTSTSVTEDELRFAVKKKVSINIDSLAQLEKYGRINAGGSVGLRVNQGIGAGEHEHVITGGPQSKFGIVPSLLGEAIRIAKSHNLKIVGLHQHIGSNVLDESIILRAMRVLMDTAWRFSELEYLDFGGGLGVPYQMSEKPLNLKRLGKNMADEFKKFCGRYGRPLRMILEPGRYLIAESGALLATVTEIKRNPGRIFVGVNSGFNHLLRPSMYGSHHAIVNASRVKGKEETATVVGNICESGDIFARDRKFSKVEEGDILAILNAGAYGFAMSSNYNSRPRPAEVLVEGGRARVIRPREKSF